MCRAKASQRKHGTLFLSRIPKETHLRGAPAADSCPAFPTVKAEGGFGGAKEAHIADNYDAVFQKTSRLLDFAHSLQRGKTLNDGDRSHEPCSMHFPRGQLRVHSVSNLIRGQSQHAAELCAAIQSYVAVRWDSIVAVSRARGRRARARAGCRQQPDRYLTTLKNKRCFSFHTLVVPLLSVDCWRTTRTPSSMGDEEVEYKAEYLDTAEDAEPEVCRRTSCYQEHTRRASSFFTLSAIC